MIGHLRDEGGAEVFRLVNERVRLGILSALAVTEYLSFADLKQTLGVTDGNLSIHARKLEEARVHRVRKDVPGSTTADAIRAHARRDGRHSNAISATWRH